MRWKAALLRAAAEVGCVSLGPVDHLDLHKRDLDFGGSYACNKRCLGGGRTIKLYDQLREKHTWLGIGNPEDWLAWRCSVKTG